MKKIKIQIICNPIDKKNEYDGKILKMPIEKFLKISSARDKYGQENLKRIYFESKKIKPTSDMNFFIKNGFIVIAPEMFGFEKDLDMLLSALL